MLIMSAFLNQCMVGEFPKVPHLPALGHKREGGPSCRKPSQHHACLPSVTLGVLPAANLFSKWDGAVEINLQLLPSPSEMTNAQQAPR